MAQINRTTADTDAEVDDTAHMQITFEIGGPFASKASAQAYADRLMDCPEFAAFCKLLDADLHCFIRDNTTGNAVARNVNGSEAWEDLPD